MNEPRVSVVIPVKDDSVRLRLCLEALSRQTLPATHFEVVVVDNGSKDDPASVAASFPFVTFCREAKPGASAARNKGLAMCRGGTIAFTDADCIPDPQWLEAGLRASAQWETGGLVAGRVQVFPRNPEAPSALELYDMVTYFDQKQFIERWHFGATANVFVNRSVLEKVPGFDEEIPYYGEDVDFGQRAWQAGFPQAYCEEAVVLHPARWEWEAFKTRLQRTTRANYDTRRGFKRLLQDFWYIGPALVMIAISLSHPAARRPLDPLRLLAVTGMVKGYRTYKRLSMFTAGLGGRGGKA